jgi:repressor LexA
VDNQEATLKVLKKDGMYVQLIPCNKEYKTRIVEAERIKIQGVLSGIIRNY